MPFGTEANIFVWQAHIRSSEALAPIAMNLRLRPPGELFQEYHSELLKNIWI